MKAFQHPEISVILLGDEDVLRTSDQIGEADTDNEGEWD